MALADDDDDDDADPPQRGSTSGDARDPLAPAGGPSASHLVQIVGLRFRRSVSGSPDRRIAAVAGWQSGCISRAQLLAIGVSSSAITRRIAHGRLICVHRGVYAVGHLAPNPLRRETAAILAMRDGAALSHATAAMVWGLPTSARGATPIHVIVGAGQAGRPAGVRVHRARNLRPADARIRMGLPVTSPARTLLDEAVGLSARDLERSFDQAIRQGLMRTDDVVELLARSVGHRGRNALRMVLSQYTTTTFTRSQAEELFLALIRQAQLPQPLTNARRHGYEVDFLWPEQRIAVEIDGFAFHGGRHAFEEDRRKDAVLTAAGIRPMRVTWRQLQGEPLAVVARVAAALRPPSPR